MVMKQTDWAAIEASVADSPPPSEDDGQATQLTAERRDGSGRRMRWLHGQQGGLSLAVRFASQRSDATSGSTPHSGVA